MAWCKYHRLPIVDHTWPNWKLHWTTAFTEMRDINCMTAGKSAFRSNAEEEDQQAYQTTASLNNLANA
jgi:hypothetical protein